MVTNLSASIISPISYHQGTEYIELIIECVSYHKNN